MTTREQLTAIWNRPGVENPGHLNLWCLTDSNRLEARQGTKRRPAWDKALLKRARKELPNWYSNKSKPY
jgi:hypothetical protein